MFEALIKTQRAALKLSQRDVSLASGISIPMIQLIESGRGNPSVKTLSAILAVLQLRLECKTEVFHWSIFAHHTGLLYEEPIPATRQKPTAETLQHTLISAAERLPSERDPRLLEVTEAALVTLRLHYPDFYADILRESAALRRIARFEIDGRHIKLKRIALTRFKDYL